jgi:hypothetical protein
MRLAEPYVTLNSSGSGTVTVTWITGGPDEPPPGLAPVPAWPRPRPPGSPSMQHCNCPAAWGGLYPAPACPVHGQAEMVEVRC